jgi:hypothetical protein
MTITQITVAQGVALQPGPPGPQGPQGIPGSIISLDEVRGWATVQYTVPVDLPYVSGGTTTWDVSVAQNARLAMSAGNTTMGPPQNVIEGAYYALRTVQDTTPRTITWDSHYHWASGTPQPPSNITGAIDIYHFRGAVGNVLEHVGTQLNVR